MEDILSLGCVFVSPRWSVGGLSWLPSTTSREGFLIIHSREAVSGSLDHAGLLTGGLFQDLLPGGDFEEPYYRLAPFFCKNEGLHP